MTDSPTQDAADTHAGRPGRALVTGATGYIGSQLVPELLARGWAVRVLTRSAGGLDAREWAE